MPRGSRLLVALSGGADSTALLLGLRNVAREFGLEIRAAHLHHGLRGADADADLDFARRLCARLGCPLVRARWNTRLRLRRRGLTGQAGLRTLRREFLEAAARRAGATAIATAHTADDQLETVLLRLLRGTGLPGLGGMRPRRGRWLKPLLGATRAAVEADLRAAGEPWREDRSNLDLRYARNRVRHEAIPALIRALDPRLDPDRARPGLARRVARAAGEARAADRALARLAAPLRAAGRVRRGRIELAPARLAAHPRAIRRKLLRWLWTKAFPGGPGLGLRHLAALDALLAGSRGGAGIELPGGVRATREAGMVRVSRPAGAPPSAIRLPVPGAATWAGRVFRGRWTSGAGALVSLRGKPPTVEYFAADGLDGALELRPGRADERFVPFGRRTPIRLGEFLSRQGVPRERRFRPGVLADGGGILWVIGVRRSARAPVTGATRRALAVSAERHD